jgi:Carbohydrate-binding family 9
MTDRHTVEAHFSATDLSADQFDHDVWKHALPVAITHYWSGELAPFERHAEARIIWTPESLSVRFQCRQAEPLIAIQNPRLDSKTIGLWDRDVAELFVAPNPNTPNEYFEFEAAPTGAWLDLGISTRPDGRETDWMYRSGMTAAARIETDHVLIAIRVPWSESLPKPERGDEWRANLCRCVGDGENRGYLAWRPTFSEKPNFHVPEAFGGLIFG